MKRMEALKDYKHGEEILLFIHFLQNWDYKNLSSVLV